MMLIPVYLFHDAPANFVILNVLLALGSLVILYLISMRLTKHAPIRFFVLFVFLAFLFRVNAPFYASPECLTSFLVMLNIYALIAPVSLFGTGLLAFAPFLLYVGNYSFLPAAIVFCLFGIFRLYRAKRKKKLFIVWCCAGMAGLFLAATSAPFIPSLRVFALSMDPTLGMLKTTGGPAYFSWGMIPKNGLHYLHYLASPITLVLAIGCILGFAWGLLKRQNRLISVAVLTSFLASFALVLSFHRIDRRYIFVLAPFFLTGTALALDGLYAVSRRKSMLLTKIIVLVTVCSIVFLVIKKNIPWQTKDFDAVAHINRTFKRLPQTTKLPILITLINPYYLDLLGSSEYVSFPLSTNQYFGSSMKSVWGNYDYNDLILLYKKIMYRGYDLYVSNYNPFKDKGIDNDFKNIRNSFILEKVSDGCQGTCDIYRLKAKERFVFMKGFDQE